MKRCGAVQCTTTRGLF